jgi:hypothetical protein
MGEPWIIDEANMADPWLEELPDLGPLFAKLNRKWFCGRLPRCRVLWSYWISTEDFQFSSLGRCVGHTIYILRGLYYPQLIEVLLHEMCHVNTPGGHGYRFRRKLARLRRLGATSENPDEYRSSTNPNRRMAMLIDGLVNVSSWRDARRILIGEYGYTAAELKRLKWARGRWERRRRMAGREPRQVMKHRRSAEEYPLSPPNSK